MSESISDIINAGSIKLVIAAFVVGGVYFEFREMKAHQDVLEQRLEKKIKVLNAQEIRIRNLENCK